MEDLLHRIRGQEDSATEAVHGKYVERKKIMVNLTDPLHFGTRRFKDTFRLERSSQNLGLRCWRD